MRTKRLRQTLLWAASGLAVLLTSCTAPIAGPEVVVTRVPLLLEAEVQGRAGGPAVDSQQQPGQPASVPNQPAIAAGDLVAGTSSRDLLYQEGAGTAGVAIPTEGDETNPRGERSAPATEQSDELLVANDGLRPLQRTHNILLLGMDQRDLDYVGRTDTVMLLALDGENDRAALISFPRDVYLPIPGVGYSRINTAYSYGETRQEGGGIPLVISTFEKNFGIPIHNYVRIDFQGFEDVVDALGGVDVMVDCAITDKAIRQDFGVAYLEAGEYHMTGEQALTYARSRKTTSDFDRARRQQRVLLALRDRVLDAGLIPRIPALWMALSDTVETDLDPAAIVELARFGANMDNKRLLGMVIRSPLVTDWITPQGGQVQLPDLPAIAEALDDIWKRKPLSETNGEERICP